MLLLDSLQPGAVPAVPSQLDGIPVRTVAAAELPVVNVVRPSPLEGPKGKLPTPSPLDLLGITGASKRKA